MSLESAIEQLTAALNANTAALLTGGKGGGASVGSAAASSGYTPRHDKNKMQAALTEVKDKLGTPAAKALIKDVGGVDKMADITDPAKIDAVYEAAVAKVKEAADSM